MYGCVTYFFLFIQACNLNHNTSDSQKRQHGIDPHYQHSRCFECCTSDLCNNGGCGQEGKQTNYFI